MVKLSEISVGARIVVAQWGGARTPGVVTEVYSDVKNGKPGVDYRLATPLPGEPHEGRWCYLSQIVQVAA